MKPNEVLSKDLHVKPLEEGQTATFQIVGANKLGNKRNKEGVRVPINPTVKQVPSMAYIYDPIKKTRIRIGNVVGEEPDEDDRGKTFFRPIVEPVLIENGTITLNWEQNDTYIFLMRHPRNKSNPWADRKKKPMFELVDNESKRREKISYDAVEDDAIILLREASSEDLMAIAEGIEDDDYRKLVNLDNSVDEVRHDLRNIIRKGHPDVIVRASDNKVAKAKLQVIEGEKWLLLKRINAKRTWYFLKGDDKKELIQVEPNHDMVMGLVDWMKTEEGKKFYQSEFLPRLKAHKANV